MVLACDDDVSTRSGTDICRLLLASSENRVPFQIQIWPFNLFESGRLILDAIADAAAADAIIVATRQEAELPPAIKEWIRAWVPKKKEQTAILIGLFDHSGGPGQVPFATFDYLKQAAKEAGIDFLGQQSLLSKNTSRSSSQHTDSAISRPPERWGLND